jgi:hypothetical protein
MPGGECSSGLGKGLLRDARHPGARCGGRGRGGAGGAPQGAARKWCTSKNVHHPQTQAVPRAATRRGKVGHEPSNTRRAPRFHPAPSPASHPHPLPPSKPELNPHRAASPAPDSSHTAAARSPRQPPPRAAPDAMAAPSSSFAQRCQQHPAAGRRAAFSGCNAPATRRMAPRRVAQTVQMATADAKLPALWPLGGERAAWEQMRCERALWPGGGARPVRGRSHHSHRRRQPPASRRFRCRPLPARRLRLGPQVLGLRQLDRAGPRHAGALPVCGAQPLPQPHRGRGAAGADPLRRHHHLCQPAGGRRGAPAPCEAARRGARPCAGRGASRRLHPHTPQPSTPPGPPPVARRRRAGRAAAPGGDEDRRRQRLHALQGHRRPDQDHAQRVRGAAPAAACERPQRARPPPAQPPRPRPTASSSSSSSSSCARRPPPMEIVDGLRNPTLDKFLPPRVGRPAAWLAGARRLARRLPTRPAPRCMLSAPLACRPRRSGPPSGSRRRCTSPWSCTTCTAPSPTWACPATSSAPPRLRAPPAAASPAAAGSGRAAPGAAGAGGRPRPLAPPRLRPRRLAALVEDLSARVEAGEKLYVHCWGGRGRAGTVGSCLIAHMYKWVAARRRLPGAAAAAAAAPAPCAARLGGAAPADGLLALPPLPPPLPPPRHPRHHPRAPVPPQPGRGGGAAARAAGVRHAPGRRAAVARDRRAAGLRQGLHCGAQRQPAVRGRSRRGPPAACGGQVPRLPVCEAERGYV